MANDEGKMVAMMLVAQMQQLAVMGEQAAKDGKLDAFEIFMLTSGASSLGMTLVQVIKGESRVKEEFFNAMRTLQITWPDSF